MGCAQSHEANSDGRASRNDDGRITVSPLVAATSPWVPPAGAAVNLEKAIVFLKERKVYASDTEQQVRLFGFLRNPELAPKLLTPQYNQSRSNLMALLKLVVSFPGFAFPAPYRADSIVQRVQQSKRCAPNAVALVQVGSVNRALLAAGRVPTHTMVDVADFWTRHASVERIQNQVFGLSEPETSENLLQSFLQPGSVVVQANYDQCNERLAQYGFGLISHFHVYDDLHNAADGTIHFAGVPQGDCVHKPREDGHTPEYRL